MPIAHQFLVIDHQNGAGAADLLCGAPPPFCAGRIVRCRQDYPKRRAATGRTTDFDEPFGGPHDSVNRCQAESAAGEFGGEEGSKMREVVASSIPSPLSPLPDKHFGGGNIVVFECYRAISGVTSHRGRDFYQPFRLRRDGLSGVDDQVHHDLFDAARVRFQARQIWIGCSSATLLGTEAESRLVACETTAVRSPLDNVMAFARIRQQLPRQVAARSDADRMDCECSQDGHSASAVLALPMITVRRLLKSCATPPASSPILSSF